MRILKPLADTEDMAEIIDQVREYGRERVAGQSGARKPRTVVVGICRRCGRPFRPGGRCGECGRTRRR